jgi:hypothetical protein
MRGQQSVCLLCRYAGPTKSKPAFNGTRRFASARDREPYVLPRLVIDLDSADNPFVNKAEDVMDNVAESSREKNRVQRRELSGNDQATVVGQKALDDSNITSYGLLSYAFLGDNLKTAHEHHYLLQYLESIGLAPMDSVKTKTEQLLLHATDYEMNLEYAGFTETTKSKIAKQIAECNSFEQLRRVISLLCTTKDGCEFLARNGSSVVQSIRCCRASPMEQLYVLHTQRVLQLLNNLRLSLESRGIQVGADICNAGLYYASKCRNVAAVQIYLNVSRRNKYKTDLRTIKSMMINWQNQEVAHGRRADLMRLLLGVEESIATSEKLEREACFSSLLEQEHKYPQAMYLSYLNVLGVLRHSDEISKEWDRVGIPDLLRENRRLKSQIFAIAFLIAKDPERAHIILDSVPQDQTDPAFPDTNKPRFRHDHLHRLSTIAPNTKSSRVAVFRFLMHYYHVLGLWRTTKLVQKVWDSLGELPSDPKLFAHELQQFLLVDYKPKPFAHEIVGWGEWNGQEGLFVNERVKKSGAFHDESPLKETPHFFKPAHEAVAFETT